MGQNKLFLQSLIVMPLLQQMFIRLPVLRIVVNLYKLCIKENVALGRTLVLRIFFISIGLHRH